MSHTTTLKGVQIRDVSAIRQAVQSLQKAGVRCELRENAKPRMYYSNQHGECPFVLHLPDTKYDVGFDRLPDGTYAPVFDEWNGYVKSAIGASCPVPSSPEGKAQHAIGRFMHFYAQHAAMNAATSQGYMVESVSTDNEGNVHLTLAA